jgi:tRNA(Ile)-lysidine synthase
MTLLDNLKKALGKLPPFKRVVVGVSGGADSVALAFLLKELGYSIVVAHMNHGLRGTESDADETLTRQLAKQWKVPCVVEKIDPRQLKTGNRENELRLLRYEFLEKARLGQKAQFIAVAHHRDDQIETILMHMARGAGLRGIRGMGLIQDRVIRPLLGIPKKELTSYLNKKNIPYRTDQSNFDVNFRRNRFRHQTIPAIRSGWPTFEKDLLAFATFAQTETDKTEKAARQWIAKNISDNTFDRKAYLKLEDDLQSEILFGLVGREDLYRKTIEEAKTLIRKGITGKQKKLGTATLKVQYGRIVLCQSTPPSFVSDQPEPITENTRWGDWSLQNLGAKGLFVRSWKPGDRLKPAGMKGSKKLQDLFTDLKIPKTERHRTPIITDSEKRILAVGNLRVARNAGYLKKYLKIEKINHSR